MILEIIIICLLQIVLIIQLFGGSNTTHNQFHIIDQNNKIIDQNNKIIDQNNKIIKTILKK